MTAWLNVKNNAESALAAAITAVATTLNLLPGDGAKFPASNFNISIDDEILTCSSRTGDVLTVTRAQEGTAAAVHVAGAIVALNVTAAVITQLQEVVNDNGTSCRASSNVDQYVPTEKYARIELTAANPDPGGNFKNSILFNQVKADSSGCSSVNIKKTGGQFTTITSKADGLRDAKVTWSSDAGGTANVGYGYITSITDANNLAIYKVSGANFANSYYFTIKQSWYQVPVTGSYVVMGSIRWRNDNIVAGKRYYCCIAVNGRGVDNNPDYSCYITSPAALDGVFSTINQVAMLTAGDLVTLLTYNTSGVDTTRIWGDVPSTSLSIFMIAAA